MFTAVCACENVEEPTTILEELYAEKPYGKLSVLQSIRVMFDTRLA